MYTLIKTAAGPKLQGQAFTNISYSKSSHLISEVLLEEKYKQREIVVYSYPWLYILYVERDCGIAAAI